MIRCCASTESRKTAKVKAVMIEAGKLDRLTKEAIAIAVSAVLGCEC